MSKTWLRQDAQVLASVTYDDTVSAGSGMESVTSIEDDLNSLRSQIKLATGETNWYDTLSGNNLSTVSSDLDTLEGTKILCPVQVLTNVTVGGSDNFAVLSVASSEAPSDVAAIGAVTTLGAVTAALPGTSGTHSLNEVAGTNALTPKNLLKIRDASTKDAITSGGQEIYGLLQIESAASDGDPFDDTTKQGQISFVIQSGDDLIACPAADIQGKTVEYMYMKRVTLSSIPEDCTFPLIGFSDNVAAVDVTRQAAYDNQGATAVDLTGSATMDLEGAGLSWTIRDDLEASLFSVVEGSAGGTSQFNVHSDVDEYDNDAALVDFAQGATFDSAGTAINVGTTAGQIDAAAALTLASTGANDLSLSAGDELNFTDGYRSSSTWSLAAGISLADSAAEWSAFETAFGEVSLLNAIEQAGGAVNRGKTVAVVTAATIAADANVTGAGGTPNIDAQLGDYSGVTFLSDVDIYVNGILQRNGADATANHDVYPGTTPANGDLKFEYLLRGGANPDQITMVIWS